ncbi:unnamed protein product [Meganyctiphanes norvegica]|uniref:Uncharacterized protein n=1 Tax=Meganyctiphanes norvegica TaxID=48144 RepID=A0AAV2SXK3_MEGNR
MDRDIPRYGNKSTLISTHLSQSSGLNNSGTTSSAHPLDSRTLDELRSTNVNRDFRPGNRIPTDILRPLSSGPLPRPDFLDIPGLLHPSRLQQDDQQSPPNYFQGGKLNRPQMEEPEETYTMISPLEQNPAAFTNIACAIDPTYQRRVQRGEIAQMNSPISPQMNSSQIASARQLPSAHLENHTLLSSSSSSSNNSHNMGYMASGTNASSPISPLPPPVFDDDDDYPVPPYMPIQGQRRTASLEKNLRSKPLKEKPSGKDGCKQQ